MASQSAASSASKLSYLPQVRIYGKNNISTLNIRDALKKCVSCKYTYITKIIKACISHINRNVSVQSHICDYKVE